MENNKVVLAMYDIRGKQEYIYKSNKIKEIMGASYLIRDCFRDYLYPAAEKCSEKGLFFYKNHEGAAFARSSFEKHLEEGYLGEVVYDGGGNFFVLYRSIDDYQNVNKIFYRDLLKHTYSLRVLTSYIEGVDFDDYKGDQRKLYEVHRKREQKESMIHPVNALPIVQTEYRNFMPLSQMHNIAGEQVKLSYESWCKYVKYEEVQDEIEGQRILDDIVTQKGEESLIAVIYIDGNNMGAQVERCLEHTDGSYESSVDALRRFSEEIQREYIENRIEEVDEVLGKGRRFVVHAGDEITFICNARQAYRVAETYLKKLVKDSPKDTPRTSCAGIAIFHSHMPYAEAYKIAEECCESGKQFMKTQGIANASLIDFHYCQGAIGTSLEDIREQEETTEISRPWFVVYEGKDAEGFITVELVKEMAIELKKAGRGNIKNLLFSAKKSEADFLMELKKIVAHQANENIDFSLKGKLDETMQRKLVYDMVMVYDLWFKTEEKGADR